METRTRARSLKRLYYFLFLTAGLMLVSGIALADDGDKRVSVTTQSLKSQKANAVANRKEYDALVKTGPRSRAKERSAQSKAGLNESSSPNIDFWFYDADVVLFNDFDQDGYYHGIDLLFDADSIYSSAEVYAVVYLSFEGGPWNEYAETDNFIINGATSDDEYIIVTELLSGYPTGSYDLLIELFDAWDNSFVAWFDSDDTSELAFLPIEDADRDAPIPEVIVVHKHGGGSMGWLLLLALVVASSRAALATGSAKRSRLLHPAGSQ